MQLLNYFLLLLHSLILTVQTRKALHFACAGGHNDCVKLLIEHGANVNVEAVIAGNRPLHLGNNHQLLFFCFNYYQIQ